jgi:hypothetical protein
MQLMVLERNLSIALLEAYETRIKAGAEEDNGHSAGNGHA